MTPRNKVDDFIKRTFINLAFIEENVDKENTDRDLYEVTQLVNSLVGLLIVPQQNFFCKIEDHCISQSTLDRLKQSISENTYKERTGSDEIVSLNTILRHMRNAVSHNKFDFLNGAKQTTEDTEIEFLDFWDNTTVRLNDQSRVRCKYRIVIGLDLLKSLLYELSDSLLSSNLHP